MRSRSYLLPLLLLLGPASAVASAGEAAGSVLSMLFGLAVVLAVIYGMLLLTKRVQQHGRSAQASVKVIGGTAVGPRERVVLVEIADTVLVLGVAPGQIHTLHTLDAASVPRAQKPTDTAPLTPFQAQLQNRLAQLMKRGRRDDA